MVARRSYAIVFAFVVMALALALISVGTYALFTNQKHINGHLQAGKLAIEVDRLSAESSFVDPADGIIRTVSDDEVGALSSYADMFNVFNLPEGALIAPTCQQSATFKVSHNEESNVAFDYYLQFVLSKDEQNNPIANPEKLASQLQVTVQFLKMEGEDLVADGTPTKFLMSELGPTLMSDKIKTVTTKDTEDYKKESYFKVTVEFLDDTAVLATESTEDDFVNNDAMTQTVWFDMVIVAQQANDHATAEQYGD